MGSTATWSPSEWQRVMAPNINKDQEQEAVQKLKDMQEKKERKRIRDGNARREASSEHRRARSWRRLLLRSGKSFDAIIL